MAFLHGLHDVSISWGQQLNLGAHNALKAQRILKARYWVGTHDEVKKGGGLVSLFLRRKVVRLEDAVREEAAGRDGDLDEVRFEEFGNGEGKVLV